MRVEVHLYSQSLPVVHEQVRNTYIKEGLFCVMMENGRVWKFPTLHIFRIMEAR